MSKVTQNRQSQAEPESGGQSERKVLVQQRRQSSPDGPVDKWVKDQLQQVYDDVVLEPVPEDFMKILKKIDQKKQ